MLRIEPRETCARLWLAASFIITIGCSADGMVNIAGDVTFDGVPVVQGTISFFPIDGQGASAEAVITAGSYSVSMPRGKKNIVIRGYKQVGERFPWGKDNPAAPILEEILPKQYNDDSNLTVDVESNRTDVNFVLTSTSSADDSG